MQFIWQWWWAVVPIAINVLAIAPQHGFEITMVMVISGVFALVCGLSAPILFHRAFSNGISIADVGVVSLGVIACSVNLYNAVESSSRLGETKADPARVLMGHRELLSTRDISLSETATDLRKRSQGDPPGAIESLIQRLKSDQVYARSRNCENVTLSDSSDLCSQIASAGMRLAAARKLEEVEKERRQIWQKLTEMESVPQSAEPGLDTITRLAGQFGHADQSMLRAIRDGWFAVAIELICTFMPAILTSRRRLSTVMIERVEMTVPPIDPEPQKQLSAPPNGLVKQWAGDRLRRVRCGSIRAGDLQRDFAAWCGSRGEPLPKAWRKVLSDSLAELGFKKSAGAYISYLDVEFCPATLRAVTA